MDFSVINQAQHQFGGEKKDYREVFELTKLMIRNVMCVAGSATS